jgi:hypothetical protein
MNDNFEFRVVGDEKTPFLGYVSGRDKTVIGGRALIRGSINVYKKNTGTIASRPGLKRRGSADTTLAGVLASTVWNTSLGRTIPLRVCNNKLQFESDIVTSGTYVWYDLKLTSTLLSPAASLTRFVFDEVWVDTEKKDRLLMARGDNNMLHWSGGLAIVGVIDAANGTIQLLDTTKTWSQMGFAVTTSGEKRITVNLGGGDIREVSYTGGESTNTLTGCSISSGTLADIPSSTLVIQSVISFALSGESTVGSSFVFDFLRVLSNQVLIGSYTSRVLYLSGDSDFTDFTNSGSLVFGDPDFCVLDNTPTGITISKGTFKVSAGTSDWYTITPNFVPPVSFTYNGNSHFIITKVDKHPGSGLVAAYAHEFIDTVGDDIVFLAKDQQVRIFGTFRNLTHPKFPSISQQVQEELKNENFAGGHLKAIGEFIHLTAPNNGRDWMYQIRETVSQNGNVLAERLWHPPQIRNISRFMEIAGVTYGHSNTYPQTYQVWDTNQWYDDSPTDEQIPYTARARFGYWNGGRRQGLIKFDKIFVEGYMSQGLTLQGFLYHNYQGGSGIIGFTVNDESHPAKFFTGNVTPSLGTSSIGVNPLGDGLVTDPDDQELLPKFKKICKVTPYDEFESAIEFYSEVIDSRWEILCYGTNIVKSPNQAGFISKSG